MQLKLAIEQVGNTDNSRSEVKFAMSSLRRNAKGESSSELARLFCKSLVPEVCKLFRRRF